MSQLYWRIHYHVKRDILPKPQFLTDCRIPEICDDFPDSCTPLIDDIASYQETLSLVREGAFCHLNELKNLGKEATDWRFNINSHDRLWLAVLHYHEWAYQLAWLWAKGDTEAGQLFAHYLRSWITGAHASSTRTSSLAWNSFTTATRVVHWIRAFQAAKDQILETTPDFASTFLKSLYLQARHLYHNVEWDVRANHLVRDLLGLAFAGRFFTGKEAARWLRFATKEIQTQVKEQVFSDGGHFEASPAYHIQVLEDLILLSRLTRDTSVAEHLSATTDVMREWLMWMVHPDGEIALLNDSAVNAPTLGVFSKTKDFQSKVGGRYFQDSGLVAWHSDAWTLFFDVASIGPLYQPGHSHADSLSIECSYKGYRLFVDPGCYHYDNSSIRAGDRATSAHNTIEIDNVSSSEVWHIFRVGRKAKAKVETVQLQKRSLFAQAEHYGYTSLPGHPIHRRSIALDDNQLVITDVLEGQGSHFLSGGFNIAPGWAVEQLENAWKLRLAHLTLTVQVESSSPLSLSVEKAAYHPQFGYETAIPRLQWKAHCTIPCSVSFVISVARVVSGATAV